MSTTKEYAAFIIEQLSMIDDIMLRKMMGEYLIYYKKQLFGGIYDNRFLVKFVPSAHRLMPEAQLEIPYPGAKPMFLVDNIEDKAFLAVLIPEICKELASLKK